MFASRRWVAALLAGLFVFVAGNAWADAPAPFKAGDKVSVAYRQVPIKILAQEVAMVEFGQPLVVQGVQGPWLWTSIQRDGKTVNGWVYGEHVAAASARQFSYDPEVSFVSQQGTTGPRRDNTPKYLLPKTDARKFR